MVGATSTTVTITPTLDQMMDYETSATWANAHNAASSTWVGSNELQPYLHTTTTSNRWDRFGRGVLLFNTSTIPSDATITSAKLGILVASKQVTLGSPDLVLTGGHLASNSSVANGDYDGFWQDEYAVRLPYSEISTVAWTNITLTNLTFIQKGTPPSFSTIYLRDSWDVNNSGPTWSSNKYASLSRWTLGSGDSSKYPFLEVTYTPAEGGSAPVSSFTTTNTIYRIPKALSVTDTSTNTPTAWNWSWGDGTWTNVTSNPSTTHTFTTRAMFPVYLLTSNAYGSNTSASQNIRIVGYENC
jgi:hypothetical protein